MPPSTKPPSSTLVAGPTPTVSPTPLATSGWIAFIGKDQHLWLTTPTGQHKGPLTSEGQVQSPAWSPDGKTLAYIHQVDKQSPGRVRFYNLSSEQSKTLTLTLQHPGTVNWSPNGRYLLLDSGTSALRQLTVVEVASGAPLYELSAFGYAWSPDSLHLALGLRQPVDTPLSLETGDSVSLAILALETGERRIIFEGTSEHLYFPRGWLPDGRLLFEQLHWDEQTYTGDYSRWTVRYIDGRVDEPQPAQEIPTAFDRDALLKRLPEDFRNASTHSFSWSPDGQWIVFRSSGGLYLSEWEAGGEPYHLTDGTAPAWQPSHPTPTPTSQPTATPSPPPPPTLLWWEQESVSVTLSAAPGTPEVDVVFFRADGLWHYDSALAQERQLVTLTTETPDAGHPVPGSLVWAPNGERVAYLTYIEEEEEAPWRWANVTVVELDTGSTTYLSEPAIFIAGGLAWSADSTELYAISATEIDEAANTTWGLTTLPLDPEAESETLLIEARSAAALSGPVQSTAEGEVRYLHFEPREIAIRQVDARQDNVTTVARIPGATAFPFAIPYQRVAEQPSPPNDTELLYLLSTGQHGWEEREGLYRFAQGESHRLLAFEGGCGLEAGLGMGHLVALGCGVTESGPLLICDITAETCWQLHESLRAAVMPVINPQDLPLAAVKFEPVGWQEAHLYFTATPYGPDVPDQGGTLFRYDAETREVTPLLSDLKGAALAPKPEE